jgi:DNA modification methylase
VPTLQFKGKSVIETYHHTVPHHRLEFDAKLSLLPRGEKPGLDGNLIIEGDNLLALKALLPTHAGKVKCIYIDPPYNTGNEGWVYNDNLTQPQFKEWIGRTVGKEGEDATRHDKWCCMMYPRLVLLKELLREDGAIFISIDDNEIHHLRSLMDEVFGLENFLATVCWQKKYSASNDHQGIAPMHDFLLVYQRSPQFKRSLLPRTHEQDKAYKNPDNDPRGPWKPMDYTCNKTKDERPNLYYPIINKHTGKEVCPDEKRVWHCSEDVTDENLELDLLWWGKDGTNAMPSLKNHLSTVQAGLVPNTWWPHEDVGHTDEAKKELQRILGVPAASMTPKPVDLLRRVVQIASGPNDIVLDSFAGSGTTAHAVLSINERDKGSRRWILVQLPFETLAQVKAKENICQEITTERVRRVIQGYSYKGQRGNKQRAPGLGGSFTYARVGDPLFSEYRDLGKKLPPFVDLAKYIFYTETSHDCDLKQVDPESGFIGEIGGKSYYLFYSPNDREDREASLKTLDRILKKDKNRSWVIYTERIWMHQEDLRQFERENGRSVRLMLVPFNLK